MKNLITRDTEPIHAEPSQFLVGQNSHGNWVARDRNGLCGGLFIGRADAIKFALSENGNRPDAVTVVDGVLELDMSAAPERQALH